MTTKITVARGDGIGPEIMDATLDILKAAGAQLEFDFVNLGEQVFKAGNMNGIEPAAWESIRNTKILFKAPITTPQGGGYKSVNVTMRKAFGLYANVRSVRTFEPFVHSKHKGVDMIIIRENEEGLYAGIEYRQTRDTCHSVKLYSRTGSELIVRYAFEYARANGRKKVTCLVKDNIMKITDGMFHQVFKLIGEEYPDIAKESLIVDIGMAKIADTPEKFDVVVCENLYGDIVSDIASQIAGSVGLAGSMNLGRGCSMFEAVHGSAPDIAGKGIANPSGLLNAAILMLYHIGQGEVAAKIGNAWLYTLENGQHTGDIAEDKNKALSTTDFAKAIIANLGKGPSKLPTFSTGSGKGVTMPEAGKTTKSARTKRMTGVDVFVDWADPNVGDWGAKVERCGTSKLPLKVISSRGMKMYPGKAEVEALSDLWAIRFLGKESDVTADDIRQVLANLEGQGFDWVKVENLYTFDNVAGFSGQQGE